MRQRVTHRRGIRCGVAVGALALAGVLLAAAPAGAQDAPGDRHDGYYYPTPQTIETYEARADTLEDSDRARRIGFVVEDLTHPDAQQPLPADFAVFAKGEAGGKAADRGDAGRRHRQHLSRPGAAWPC